MGQETRVIFYCVEPGAYHLLRMWAERQAHKVALVVTTPGPARARSGGYREIIAQAPPNQDILVTTGMKRVAPMIAALRPDLIVSFTFPFRIPPEVTSIPRHGAVNLHPAPLPRYRGPNPVRMIYDGDPELGATLHRTAEGFDTGAILSQHICPLPDDPSPSNILLAWSAVMTAALDEGTARALADAPGTAQDDTRASYAAPFSEEETWLDWNVPAATFYRRASALSLFTNQARAMIEGQPYRLGDVHPVANHAPSAAPGTVKDKLGDTFTVYTADGLIGLTAIPLSTDPAESP